MKNETPTPTETTVGTTAPGRPPQDTAPTEAVTTSDAAVGTTAPGLPPQDTAPTTAAIEKKPISSADKVKFIGLIAFFLLIIAVSIYAVIFISNMGSDSLEVELERAISDAGVFGILICLGIQFVQVVVAFIPGEAAQVAIGYFYGTIGGGFVTLAGALIATICVFYLVRKLGAPFVQGMIGGKDSGRFKFLHESKNLNSLIFILYLIPGLPKDVFTYVVPLTDIRPHTFFVLATIARAPAVFATTFVVTAFKAGDYLSMIIVAVIFGGLGLIGIFFNQKIMDGVEKLMKRFSPRRHHHEGVLSEDAEQDAGDGEGAVEGAATVAAGATTTTTPAATSGDASIAATSAVTVEATAGSKEQDTQKLNK
jgi:uncharacterized membrane protein YdjX (TVP38/TMEM64 family)